MGVSNIKKRYKCSVSDGSDITWRRAEGNEPRTSPPLGPGHAPSREAVVLIVVVRTRVDIRAIEIQVVGVRRIVGSR